MSMSSGPFFFFAFLSCLLAFACCGFFGSSIEKFFLEFSASTVILKSIDSDIILEDLWP